MKKTGFALMSLLLLGISTLQSGCFGKFALVRAVYSFNDKVSDDKFVKSIIFWALCIIPVYEVAGFIDAVFFNLIEFWKGSNPIAMKEGEKETQVINSGGNRYEVTATRNNFHIKQLSGPNGGKELDLNFNPAEKSWNLVAEGKTHKLVQLNNDATATLYKPNGETMIVPAGVNSVAQASSVLQGYSDVALAK